MLCCEADSVVAVTKSSHCWPRIITGDLLSQVTTFCLSCTTAVVNALLRLRLYDDVQVILSHLYFWDISVEQTSNCLCGLCSKCHIYDTCIMRRVLNSWVLAMFKCTLMYRYSALALLVGCHEEHPACRYWVMRCWCTCGYLSGARCRLFAYGPADSTAIQKLKEGMFAVNVQSVSIQQLNWDIIVQYIQNTNSFPVVCVIDCTNVRWTLRYISRNVQLITCTLCCLYLCLVCWQHNLCSSWLVHISETETSALCCSWILMLLTVVTLILNCSTGWTKNARPQTHGHNSVKC